MAMLDSNDFDITSNIRAIETLKCQVLHYVSELFDNLVPSKENSESLKDSTETIAKTIITLFLLGEKLGISKTELNDKILNKLKLELLKNDYLSKDISSLYKFFEEKDNF